MENNNLLEKIRNGEKVAGFFFNSGTVVSLEVLGSLGFDFAVIDAEHCQYDFHQIEDFIRAAEFRGLIPIVRTVDCSRNYILKTLDMGAMGLFLPFIKTADEVRQAISYAKYPPVGERGLGHAHKVAYGRDPIVLSSRPEDYLEWANENTLVIPQCETVDAVKNIEEILSVAGVAGIFVGPYDLSISMGLPCQFDNPKFISAVEHVRSACVNAGKFVFTMGMTPEDAEEKIRPGFQRSPGNRHVLSHKGRPVLYRRHK